MFQSGGSAPEAMPAEQSAPAPAMQEQGNAEQQLQELAGQLLEALLSQLQDPNLVAQVLELAMSMLQEAAGQGEPRFRCGGKMVKKAKKACGGGSMKK